MVLRLRLLGPPFAPWLRMPAANSGLSMTDRHPPGVGRDATVGITREWVPGLRDGTGRCRIGCWPRQFGVWEVRSRGCDERDLEVKKPIYGRQVCRARPPRLSLSGRGWSLERGFVRTQIFGLRG
jgi:hypothetical protein